MSRNGSIDVLRLLLAFIVVVNHTCIFGAKLQDTIDCAVPVFLMISGYYFYSNRMEEEIRKCRKSVAKLFSIILGSVMLYVLWDVAKFLIWGEHTEYSIYTLFTCTNYFCPPLWYIHAMLYLYAFLYLIETMFKRLHIDFSFSRQHAILLLLAFITLRMLMGYYSSFHNIVLCLSFLILGLVQAKIKWVVRKDIALIGGGITVVADLMYNSLFQASNAGMKVGYHISTILIAVFLFQYFKGITISNDSLFSRLGRSCSLHIYIVHWIFIEIIHLLPYYIPFPIRLLLPFVVFTLSLLSSYGYILIKRKLVTLQALYRGTT